MIRIGRTPEPSNLATLRVSRLAQARAALQQGNALELQGYDLVKRDLAAMQHDKCCYCEQLQEGSKYRDVEHYRPKSLYWWLTWTWENLLFACNDCNRTYKRDQFPLEPGCSQLVAEQAPPAGERPLVLDPADPSVEPTQEIEFRRERVAGAERWVPRGLSPRGRETIRVCGLDRPGLLGLYVAHVNNAVRPKLEAFFTSVKTDDSREMLKAWQTATRGLLARKRPFRALSYDALKVLVSPALRDKYRLTLERPAP